MILDVGESPILSGTLKDVKEPLDYCCSHPTVDEVTRDSNLLARVPSGRRTNGQNSADVGRGELCLPFVGGIQIRPREDVQVKL